MFSKSKSFKIRLNLYEMKNVILVAYDTRIENCIPCLYKSKAPVFILSIQTHTG